MSFIETLKDVAVVAVVRGNGAEQAITMCEALIRGGVRGVELTFTNPGCLQALEHLRKVAPDSVVLGVGSVRAPEQIEAAIERGAQFAVSPHFDPQLMVAALEADLPYLPGGITPTEMVQCWDSGAAAVKLFPANMVGPSFIKSVHAPMPDIPVMPTGGVTPENFTDWLDAGAVAVGMGGNLVKGDAAAIEATARTVSQRLADWRNS